MNRIHRLLLIGSLLFAFPFSLVSQSSRSFKEEARFIRYLNAKGLHADALLVISDTEERSDLDSIQADSLLFFAGDVYERMGEHHFAIGKFADISPTSSLHIAATFRSAWNQLNLWKYKSSRDRLDMSMIQSDPFLLELRAFEFAGISLLQRNYQQFDSLYSQLSHRYPQFEEEAGKMAVYRNQLSQVKRRSPAVAGIMSAIIPGSGKIYAGKTREGLTTLLPLAFFGLQTWEGFRHKGWKSPRFYIFGSLFTVFYVGNIWGSVLSVKIHQHDQYHPIDSQILVDLRVPLRTLFE